MNESTRMKNKMAGLLMEVGAEYNKGKLDGKAYFSSLLCEAPGLPGSVVDLLGMSRCGLFTNTN